MRLQMLKMRTIGPSNSNIAIVVNPVKRPYQIRCRNCMQNKRIKS